jgi:hypothetical protein
MTGCVPKGTCLGSAWRAACAALLLCSATRAQTATAWPEADRLFHSDPRWLGADAAFSVDLGHGRVLWLFGDSFVTARAGQTRRQARMVRNSVAIESGYDPSAASIRFYWGSKGTQAASFIPDEGENWFWPMHGVRLGDRLLLFCFIVGPNRSPHSLGFRNIGWTAFLVPNPDDDPSRWTLRKLAAPDNPWRVLVGVAARVEGDRLFLFAADEPRHDVFLLRLPVARAAQGQLDSMEWWCGERRGWLAQSTIDRRPAPVFLEGETEFSVQRDTAGDRYLQVQTVGFGATDIALRTAARLEGPWTPARKIYRPPESDAPDAFVYAGKAHPELWGADLIVTYAANGKDSRVAEDLSLYFPRFVRIRLTPPGR